MNRKILELIFLPHNMKNLVFIFFCVREICFFHSDLKKSKEFFAHQTYTILLDLRFFFGKMDHNILFSHVKKVKNFLIGAISGYPSYDRREVSSRRIFITHTIHNSSDDQSYRIL